MKVQGELKYIFYLLLIIGSLVALFNWEKILINLLHYYYKLKYKTGSINFESKIETITFASKSYAGISKEIKVYLPKTYAQDKEKKFPVLYLLHGFPGSDSDWLINTNLQKQLDDLIDAKKIPPIIVVFPDGNGPIIHDSQYLNATKIIQPAEDYIIDVVNEIDSRFRTLSERGSRAIGGLSSGAYGAINIGLHKNNIFAIIISHSGYFINQEGITKNLLNPDDLKADYNNPLRYIEKVAIDPATFIYMDIGSSDKKSYITDNKEMDKIMTRMGIIHILNITEGWHDWGVWNKNISESLKFLGNHIKT